MEKAVTWAARACLALLVAGAVLHLALRMRLIGDPRTDLGGAEINVAYGTQKLLLGRPLYTDPEQPPFEAIQLAPFFHLLSAGIARIAGIDPLDTAAVFAVGRALALALNVLAAALLFGLARRMDAAPGLALGLACIGLAMITEHAYGRSDALATPLALAALLVAVQGGGQGFSWARAAAVAGLCASAVLAKQTEAVIPALIALHLALARDTRTLVRFSAMGALAAALSVGLLLLLGTPAALWQNLVGALRNGIDPTLYRELLDKGVLKYHAGWHLLTVATGALLLRSARPAQRLMGLAALGAFAAGLAGGLKSGSGLNYLVDGQLLALAGAPALLAGLPQPRRRVLTLLIVAYGAFFMQHRGRLLAARAGDEARHAADAQALEADRAVHAFLRDSLRLAPDEPVMIAYRGHLELLRNGQGLLPQKDLIAWSTEPPFDLRALHALIAAGGLRVVVAEGPLDSLRLPGGSYALAPLATVQGRAILRPVPR